MIVDFDMNCIMNLLNIIDGIKEFFLSHTVRCWFKITQLRLIFFKENNGATNLAEAFFGIRFSFQNAHLTGQNIKPSFSLGIMVIP